MIRAPWRSTAPCTAPPERVVIHLRGRVGGRKALVGAVEHQRMQRAGRSQRDGLPGGAPRSPLPAQNPRAHLRPGRQAFGDERHEPTHEGRTQKRAAFALRPERAAHGRFRCRSPEAVHELLQGRAAVGLRGCRCRGEGASDVSGFAAGLALRAGAVRCETAFRKRPVSSAASAGAPSATPRSTSSSQSASDFAKSDRTYPATPVLVAGMTDAQPNAGVSLADMLVDRPQAVMPRMPTALLDAHLAGGRGRARRGTRSRPRARACRSASPRPPTGRKGS